MSLFDTRFSKYLATGDYESVQDTAPVPTVAPAKKSATLSPEAVVAQDAAEKYLALDAAFVGGNAAHGLTEYGKAMHPGGKMPKSLAEHDKVHHPDGYKEGDHCKFRENQAKKDEADDLSGTQGTTPSSSGASELDTAKNVLAKLRAERGDDNKYMHEWETEDLQGETAYTVFAGVEGERVRSKDLEEALQEAGIKTARVDIIPGNKLLVTGISAS